MTTVASNLTLDQLRSAVLSDAAAIRSIARLQPLGGPGDKVFPPTFGDPVEISIREHGSIRRHRTKYAAEERRIDGHTVVAVVLDSVASQANRMEEALQEGWERGELSIPVARVNFLQGEDDEDLSDLGTNGIITSLQAPHRLADALLRDSLLDGVLFRASDEGRAFTNASATNATAVYDLCPTALLFGMWDSTGPKGGLGAKFQRALVSEIVALNAVFGRKTSSRIDPAGIQKKAGPIYRHPDRVEDWTDDPDEAAKAKGKPEELRRGGERSGSPSVINHGNVTPTVDPEAGGITFDHSLQTTVLSLAALRRLRFPRTTDGRALTGDELVAAEGAARTALAALGLAAIVYQRDQGYDLRSRCALQPEVPPLLEILPRNGSEPRTVDLDRETANQLLSQAVEEAGRHGMGWRKEPLELIPAPKLSRLIRKSRSLLMAGEDDAGEH